MTDADDFEEPKEDKPPVYPWGVSWLFQDKAAVLASLERDAGVAALPYKTPNAVFKRASEMVREIYIEYMHNLMYTKLQQAYAAFVTAAGQRPTMEGLQADEWDSAIDDDVQTVVEEYATQLSASWLGEKTVDTRLHVAGELDKLAASFATEMWRQATYKRDTPAKILSSAGVVMNDIALFAQRYNAQPKMELVPDMNMNGVLNKIMLAGGGSADVFGDLGLVLDDSTDDFLVSQASQRLGIDTDDVDTLRMAAMGGYTAADMNALIEAGDILDEEADEPTPVATAAAEEPETEEDLSELIGDAPAPAAEAPPAAPQAPVVQTSTAPPPPPAKGKRKGAKDEPPAGTTVVPAEALQIIRDHANVKDEDAATLLGFSRATYNNYVKGKGVFYASETQRDTLRKLVEKKVEALNAALEVL